MEDKMARVAILQNIQTRYGEYAKQISERREYELINPDSEHGGETLSVWACSRMAGEVRAGLPAMQRKVRESQEAIDRAKQRVGELNTRVDAIKERIRGIDGGSLQQLGKDLQRVRQDIDEARRQRHAIAERFGQVEYRLPDSEQAWDAKRAILAKTFDTYEERLRDANVKFRQLVGSVTTGSATVTSYDGTTSASSRTKHASATIWTTRARSSCGRPDWTRLNCRMWPN